MHRVPVFIILATALVLAVVPVGGQEQRPSRVIVELRGDVSFDAFASEYVADARLQDSKLHGHHSRAVLGAILTLERRYGVRAYAFFTRAVAGFAAHVTPAQRARLAADPLVKTIEADDPVALVPIVPAAQIIDWGIFQIGANLSTAASGDGAGTVSGVHVYVIDTGVELLHPDLNVVEHVTFAGEPNADCNGHGTGVAGIIAARDNTDFTVGVAPGAPVHGVKVLTCGGIGFPSSIVAGVDWVAANAMKPAVANMSIGSLIPLSSLNTAVRNAAASGIVFAVAAGNGNPFSGEALNACFTSPAGAGLDFPALNGIVTVAATDMSDQEADFSNFGPCVNLWAPGVAVTSTWLTTDGGLITASGTSFSSPYVAGAAALLLSRFPTLTPPQVEYVLRVQADVPGTLSKDGATIRRLQVKNF
jgi:subtilisin family serine protease